jgi:hypothetical protein
MRLEHRVSADGETTIMVETDDMVPGMECEPWLVAWSAAIESTRATKRLAEAEKAAGT